MSSVADDKFSVVGKVTEVGNVSLRKIFTHNQLFKYRYLGSIPSDFFSILPHETFAIINTQPSNFQGEHSIMNANSCHQLYFADALGSQKHSFSKQKYKWIMPEILQSHPSVCHFYKMYATFHLIKIRQQKNTEVHDVIVLPDISIYMYYFNL